ncbi:MAG: TrkH family potassium uptake protein [Ruminococcaceae bacterium]|nr:TrkH family potassium uptake protein [Oscillospiraceae bacterium]
MNYKMMGLFLSRILAVEGLFMLPALGISIFCGEISAVKGFVVAIAVIIAVDLLFYFICRGAPSIFQAKEGLVCVGISWIFLSLVGCIPFIVSGEIPSFIDAFFEISSGFTTTGSSILTDIEALPKGIIYWRSFSNWLGGMGVLVFLLAFVGGNGKGFTMHLLRAESPGPDVEKLVPKMKKTATILYFMYIVLSAVDLILLLIGGMPLFDAVCTMFSTAGTGGFGVKNDGFASFSPYIQNVTSIFMFLFGINFSCYFLVILGHFKEVFKDEELRLYIGIAIFSTAAIFLNIHGLYDTLGETVRHAAFQVSSIMTSTGFASTDFNLWPPFSKAILLSLMLVGACAGSTGGGLKYARLLLLLKGMKRNIEQIMRPRKVLTVKNNGKAVDEKVLDNANAYLAAYALIIIISFVIVSFDGFSLETNISAVVSCFNNIGPGFDAVGPMSNFSAFNPLSKLVLIIDMLAGRLEIFPILVLFSSGTWKKH